MKEKQEEKLPVVMCYEGFARVKSGRLNPTEAQAMAKYLNEWAESCNVATAVPVVPKTALFDSSNDPTVYTLEVDNKILTDFQTLRGGKEDLRKTIIALMDYYSNQDSLNIILTSDALEKRQSYIKFTAQLANYLTHNQENYTQCKVQFDSLTTRLGIFCRKGTEKSSLNSNFLGSVTAALKAYGSAQVDTADIPLSYLGNRASLKHLLTKRLGKTPRITWHKDGVAIYV